MARMKPPRVPEQPVDVPTVEDVQKLLAACEGNDLEARRDTAIVRLFADSGLRLAELTGLRLTDVDLSAGMVGVPGRVTCSGRHPSGERPPRRSTGTCARVERIDAESEATWLGLKGPLTEPASVRCSGGVPKRLASRGCIRTSSALLRALMARRRWAAVRSDGAHRVAYEDDGHEVRGLDAGRACPRGAQAVEPRGSVVIYRCGVTQRGKACGREVTLTGANLDLGPQNPVVATCPKHGYVEAERPDIDAALSSGQAVFHFTRSPMTSDYDRALRSRIGRVAQRLRSPQHRNVRTGSPAIRLGAAD